MKQFTIRRGKIISIESPLITFNQKNLHQALVLKQITSFQYTTKDHISFLIIAFVGAVVWIGFGASTGKDEYLEVGAGFAAAWFLVFGLIYMATRKRTLSIKTANGEILIAGSISLDTIQSLENELQPYLNQ